MEKPQQGGRKILAHVLYPNSKCVEGQSQSNMGEIKKQQNP